MRISDWSSDVCSSDLAALAEKTTEPIERWSSNGASSFGASSSTPNHRGRTIASTVITCASPIVATVRTSRGAQIGRASGRQRVCQYVSISVVDVSLKNNKQYNNNKSTSNKYHT